MPQVYARRAARVNSDDAGDLHYRSPIDAKGYAIAYHCITQDDRISDGAFRTYLVLLGHAMQSDHCWPGQVLLAKERGCQERSIRNHLNELEKIGLIHTDHDPARGNTYWIEDLRDVYGVKRTPKDHRQKSSGAPPNHRQKSSGATGRNVPPNNLSPKKNSYIEEKAAQPNINKTSTGEGRQKLRETVANLRKEKPVHGTA